MSRVFMKLGFYYAVTRPFQDKTIIPPRANIKIMRMVMISRHACIRALNRASIGLLLQYHGELFDQQQVYGSQLLS